jgi:biotin synthase-related radical SAM superfamily protein
MTNQKQTKNQPQEQTQTQQTQEPREIQIAKKVIERVKSQADGSTWVSERLIETDNIITTVSTLDGKTISIWLKPPTLRNGLPLVVDDNIEQKIEDLKTTVEILEKMLPVLKQYVTPRGRKTYTPTEDRIVIRRRY